MVMAEGGVNGVGGIGSVAARVMSNVMLDMMQMMLQQGGGAKPGGESSGGSSPAAGAAPSAGPAPGGSPAPGGANPNAGAPSGLPSDPSHDQAAQAIHDNLKDRYGLNDTQIAGVLGNLEQESGLHGDINQGGGRGAASGNFADDNGNGWGLAQWGGTRK